MNTRARAEALASALIGSRSIVPTTAADLIALVRTELGHEEVLDQFVPYGSHRSRAVAPARIVHVIAGNTPAAGLQSLVRGLLLGSQNFAKLPSEGLPDLEDFIRRLPSELSKRVIASSELSANVLDEAEAIVVFGSDATIESFRTRLRSDQLFIPHGHRVSFGVIFDDPDIRSAPSAARDVTAFDQLGCLSPHVFYVAGNAHEYAAGLAAAMANEEGLIPRRRVPVAVANRIRALREEYHFRAANREPCALWTSEGSTAWTVVFDATPGFPNSPLHRTIFVKPLSPDLAAELAPVRRHLSCVGIHPVSDANAAAVSSLGVSRICPVGRMQGPGWTWHQDGLPTLASLVRWVDLEEEASQGLQN